MLRIIRIIRLIRIVKLYKSAVMARANYEKKKKEKQRYVAYQAQAMLENSLSDESSKSMTSRILEPNPVIDSNPQTNLLKNEVDAPDPLIKLRSSINHGSQLDSYKPTNDLISQDMTPINNKIYNAKNSCKTILIY